jgi:hypothetical protein
MVRLTGLKSNVPSAFWAKSVPQFLTCKNPGHKYHFDYRHQILSAERFEQCQPQLIMRCAHRRL